MRKRKEDRDQIRFAVNTIEVGSFQSLKFDLKKDLPVCETMISKNGKGTNKDFKGLGITTTSKKVKHREQEVKLPGEDDLDADIAEIFYIKLDKKPTKPLKNDNKSLDHPEVIQLR